MSYRIYYEEKLIYGKKKTKEYQVLKNKKGTYVEVLGIIKWSGRWRQFIFEPETNIIWSSSCLTQIAGFLIELNQEKKYEASI